MSKDPNKEQILLTPGPLNTHIEVKESMLVDWGSRDKDFIALTRKIRQRLLKISGAYNTHTCIPIQGSGTFAIEAALNTLTSKKTHTLVIKNGAYGERASKILNRLDRPIIALNHPEDRPIDPELIQDAIFKNKSISHVFLVHCETTTGVLNPLNEVSKIVQDSGKILILDSMSTFAGIPYDISRTPVDILIASSNKCIEGVPGIGFVIAREELLSNFHSNSSSISLDIFDQWAEFENSGQWRFTPPTHVLAALDKALDILDNEGGVAGRFARYFENCKTLVDGMKKIGFRSLLNDDIQAPIIVTFHMPSNPKFNFDNFFEILRKKGFTIYPGKLTKYPTFRIGCIGNISYIDIEKFISETRAALSILNIDPNQESLYN